MIGNIGGRRRASGGVTVVEGPRSTASSGSVAFTGTPTDGQLIVLLVGVDAGTATIGTPSGFTAGPSKNQGGLNPVAMFWRVASSEPGSSYSVSLSGGSGNVRVMGYLLSGHNAAPVGNSGSDAVDTAGTSYPLAASAISVSAGSVVLAFRMVNSTTSSPAFDNSFTGTNTSFDGGRGSSAYRSYASADVSQNTTSSWTTSRNNRRGLLVEILKA